MADETPKPKSKRRRWIIVGSLLFAILTWWFWPRRDQRYVGKWLRQSESTIRFTLTFNSNGRGYSTLVNERGEVSTSSWSWSVEGNVLAIGTDYGRWDSTAKWLSLQLEEWLGKTFEPLQTRFTVRRLDGDTMEVESESGRLFWRRTRG